MKIIEKNGYKISELTLGTVQLGIPYGINNQNGKPSYEEAEKILKTAVSGGIVSFDTARDYGDSEAVLGRFFTENPYPNTLITKLALHGESHNELKDAAFRQAKESIDTLGVKKLPLLLIHHEKDLDIYGKSLTDALKSLKEEGLVDSIGISFSNKSRLIELADPEVFDSVQITSNMFDNEEIRNGKIKKLNDSGITVYVRSVYLQGLFFKNTNYLPVKLQCAKTSLDKLNLLAKDNNLSMAALALSYMRGVKEVTSLVMGCETASQLEESLALFDLPSLSKNIQDKITEISEEVDPIVIRPWEWNN